MRKDFLFTSQSVTEGHPDKLCDQISDAIVDRFLRQDPMAAIIAECGVGTAILFVAARFAANASVDIPEVARQIIAHIGCEQAYFKGKACTIVTSLQEMRDSRRGVDERNLKEDEIDRVTVKNPATVFGFACDQSAALMPLPIWLAHKVARRLASVRLQRLLPYLAPDGETQVGVEYRDRRPSRIHSLTIVATQTDPPDAGGPNSKRLHDDVKDAVIDFVFQDEEIKPDSHTLIAINPEGQVIGGGPAAHAGLTGRKTAIDTYGEYARHSGAALSGKDPSRIDRIGAYAARYAAKNVVAAGLASECEVQLSYSIGLSQPVSIQVETFGTGRIADEAIAMLLRTHFDFRPAGIIRQFNLRWLPSLVKGGFYRKLAAYGHVGRMDISLPWEVTDKIAALRQHSPR
jgi:S-adenosylmethionine synthetase